MTPDAPRATKWVGEYLTNLVEFAGLTGLIVGSLVGVGWLTVTLVRYAWQHPLF